MANMHLNNKRNQHEIPPPYGQEGCIESSRPFDQLMVENGDVITPYYETNSFKKFSVRTTCNRCNLRVTTNVDKKLDGEGWCWVICCCLACFGGGWFLGLLVLCADTFWKFNHYCPRCSNKLATYSPEASCRIHTLLILIVLAVVALNGFIGWYFGMYISAISRRHY